MTTAHDSPDSAELAPPQDDLATRKALGQYELKKKLGQGGMGAVYLAVDTSLKRSVALKILPREKAANPQLVKRFKAEAQNASQLTHDNIVAVYGAGEADGYLYIALEYVDGIDVHDLVQRRGVLPVKRSIDIIKQVGRALQHAFEQGIVHRDIKPANLLIRRDGIVKLADMGLARAVDETLETSITRAGTTVGTVDYMSPEQARNSKSADVRSDIYSLGCTWYHMLTGSPPYSEGSLVNKLNAHAKQPPPDPRDKNPAVPEGVVAVMQRMLAKGPDERYQTPLELIKDLEGALVNRDAVSQRILEAIDDDSVHGDEYSDPQVPVAHDQGDSYPVEVPFSDSVEAIQAAASDPDHPVAPHRESPRESSRDMPRKEVPHDDVPHSPRREAPRDAAAAGSEPSDEEIVERSHKPSGKVKPGAPAQKGSTAPPPNSRQAPSTPTPPPTAPTSHKSTTQSHSTAPHKSTTSAGRTSQSSSPAKPAAASSNRPHTLPPPKRKTDEDSPDKTGAKSGPMKQVLTLLGIVAGIAVLVFLAHLAQQAGEATAPAVVSPFEGQLPPPPGPPQAPQAANETAAGADQPNQTVKDVLIDINELSAGNGAAGPEIKRGAGPQNLTATGDQTPKFVPDWADAAFNTNQVPMFSVRKGPTVETERRYGSLQEAFKSAGNTGARIVLFHDGPFDLIPTDITSNLLIIEAAQGAQPRIRLVADGEHRKLPWLNVTNGTLILDGVNFIGDEGIVPSGDAWSWVRVTNGHLHVRRSSFTLTAKRTGPTTALRVVGKVTDPVTKEVSAPHVLVDQSVLRGEGLRCLQLESPGFEGVVRQSLLVAGDAPAVTIRGSDPGIPKAIRELRFVNATVCSREQALFLSSQGAANPIQTDIILHEALFAAPANAAQSVLLFLEDWPLTRPRMAGAPPYKNLNWKATGSAVLGFRPLAKRGNDDADSIADGSAWRKQFQDQSTITFAPLNWPTEVPGSNSAAPLKTWSLKSLEKLAITFPVPNVTPGCLVSKLQVPDYSEAAKTASNQPQRPRPPVPFAVKSTQSVDLNKTDLGKLMGSKDWEDGTVFVASGSGQRYSSPITVERHKWRIQFQQTEGPTLIVSPRSGPRSGSENGAFITIRGGQLDIERGSFIYDTKDAQSVTPWFIYAEGGGFSLLNCRVMMPTVAANRNRGLIRWAPATNAEKAPPDSEFANFCQLTDSLLVGNGTLVSADLGQRAILLNNCALVSRQHLFELNVGLNEGKAAAAVDSQNCTYLAGGTQWAIQSQAPAGSSPLPVRFAHYHCVFGALPADSNSKTAPLLMNYIGQVPAASQLLWYEESCGYSPELKAFFATETALPTVPLKSQDWGTEWNNRWGPDRVQRPLTGADGVLFEKNLAANFVQVRPENLRFHQTAKAKSWSESGGPIGVRAAALEPPAAPPKSSPNSKKTPNKVQPKVTF